MDENVKIDRGSSAPADTRRSVRSRRDGQTRISSKHQVTIPKAAFEAAGLNAGERVRVEAEGPGRVVLTRLEALLDRYQGCLPPGTLRRDSIEDLRDEWR